MTLWAHFSVFLNSSSDWKSQLLPVTESLFIHQCCGLQKGWDFFIPRFAGSSSDPAAWQLMIKTKRRNRKVRCSEPWSQLLPLSAWKFSSLHDVQPQLDTVRAPSLAIPPCHLGSEVCQVKRLKTVLQSSVGAVCPEKQILVRVLSTILLIFYRCAAPVQTGSRNISKRN